MQGTLGSVPVAGSHATQPPLQPQLNVHTVSDGSGTAVAQTEPLPSAREHPPSHPGSNTTPPPAKEEPDSDTYFIPVLPTASGAAPSAVAAAAVWPPDALWSARCPAVEPPSHNFPPLQATPARDPTDHLLVQVPLSSCTVAQFYLIGRYWS